jgi:hypothetical protein
LSSAVLRIYYLVNHAVIDISLGIRNRFWKKGRLKSAYIHATARLWGIGVEEAEHCQQRDHFPARRIIEGGEKEAPPSDRMSFSGVYII